jgi:hypothetical protein
MRELSSGSTQEDRKPHKPQQGLLSPAKKNNSRNADFFDFEPSSQ